MNIEELAKEAGMESALNMGSGSCVSSPGCNGVTQKQLEIFACLVAERCAGIVYEVRMRLGDEVSDLRENIRDTIRQEFGI